MSFFTPLMRKSCKVAFVHFSHFFLSLGSIIIFLTLQRCDEGFAEHFHALAVSADKCNFSPNAFDNK